MAKPLGEWTDKELTNLMENYIRLGKTTGGSYSLEEIKTESQRRKSQRVAKTSRDPNPIGTRECFAKIIEIARASPDSMVTYRELWTAFRPDEQWKGHSPMRILGDAMARVHNYCFDNKLPIVTVMVVQKATRRLSEAAKENIFEYARNKGLEVGLDRDAFIERQITGSLKLSVENLPD